MNTCDDEFTMSNTDEYMGRATLTAGGTSAMVARKSQMRPLSTVGVLAHDTHHDLPEGWTTHLSPHQTPQTVNARFVKTETEQANKHDEK